MACVVIFTTMSFTVDMHFCGDTLVDVALFKEAKNCGMEMAMNTPTSNEMKGMSCCHDEQIVSIGQDDLKPSFQVKGGERITAKKGPLTIVYEVTKIIEKRVSATLAAECYVDHSPPPPPKPTIGKKDSAFFDFPVAHRKRGEGRPTKRDRRDWDKHFR